MAKRDGDGAISYKDALREALVEEMTRDERVILYGEDVADYGGAFKLTKGLLEAFGRERVFNTPDLARPASAAPPSAPRSSGCARWSS